MTEPQKLEINCRRHTASHYSEAAWPCSTLSQSISYYNHANCGQIRDLTYWYYISVQPPGYASLLGASNNMHYAPLLFSVETHKGKTLPQTIRQYCYVCVFWRHYIFCVCVGGVEHPNTSLHAKLLCHLFFTFFIRLFPLYLTPPPSLSLSFCFSSFSWTAACQVIYCQ